MKNTFVEPDITLEIKVAQETRKKLRLLLMGLPGSGKTYTALRMAFAMGQKVCVIDAERSSACMYAKHFENSYHIIELDYPSSNYYIKAIELAEKNNVDVLIIDSISQEWEWINGYVDALKAENRGDKNINFGAWAVAKPMHNKFLDSIFNFSGHVIALARTKIAASVEATENGKMKVKQMSESIVGHNSTEYEFDFVAEMQKEDHSLYCTKSRIYGFEGQVFAEPDEEFGKAILESLNRGVVRKTFYDHLNEAKTAKEAIALIKKNMHLMAVEEKLNKATEKVFNCIEAGVFTKYPDKPGFTLAKANDILDYIRKLDSIPQLQAQLRKQLDLLVEGHNKEFVAKGKQRMIFNIEEACFCWDA